MSHSKFVLTVQGVNTLVNRMVAILNDGITWPAVPTIYGVPRGGVPVALAIAGRMPGAKLVDRPEDAWLIVDDVIDSGKTRERYQAQFPEARFMALVDKSEPAWATKWVQFPWEVTDTQSSEEDIITRLLQFIGEDPNREGLRETPRRVLKGWTEWAQGYKQDPKDILKTFVDGAEGVNELVVVHNIPIISKCEHHLADIMGIAHIGYIPNGRIVGLSKLARLADMYARRLQVQERLTNQIANTLDEVLSPLGVGVIIRSAHHCMSTRGVKIHGSVTTTSAMRGVLLTKPEARMEFLTLCTAAEQGSR